jgi:DNA-directed RNA polymerase subunit RPC12/RpoP
MATKRISFEGYKKRLRTFSQYKNYTDAEFESRARELYEKKYGKIIPPFDTSLLENEVGVWLSVNEADEAKKIYDTYIEKNNVTNFSDLALLKNLVNNEIQLKRIQSIINELSQNERNSGKTPFVPTKELDAMNDIVTQIISLKKILGLSNEKKGNDPLEYINTLKRKFKIWRENNQGSRTLICPQCSKMVMLKIRTEAWEAIKHPFFFKDKILSNAHLWDMYKSGKINLLDVCKVLLGKECDSTAYGEWLERKVFNVQENKDPLLEKESGN